MGATPARRSARCCTRLIADGEKETPMIGELEKIWDALPFESQWYSRNELERHKAFLSASLSMACTDPFTS